MTFNGKSVELFTAGGSLRFGKLGQFLAEFNTCRAFICGAGGGDLILRDLVVTMPVSALCVTLTLDRIIASLVEKIQSHGLAYRASGISMGQL
jgi:hypothetical protein